MGKEDGFPISEYGLAQPRFGLGFGARNPNTETAITFAYGLEKGPSKSQKNRIEEGHLYDTKLHSH